MPSSCLSLLLAAALLTAAAQDSSKLIPELRQALAAHDEQKAHSIKNDLLSGRSSLDDLLLAGSLFGEQDLLNDSATIFEKCLALYPASFEAHYDLAFARLNLGQLPDAERAIDSAAPSSPTERAAVEYLRGKIYEASGNMQKAHQNLENAYRAQPQQESYALDLALLDLRSYAYIPAIDILQSASLVHPASQEIKLELALANALAGRDNAALATCRSLQADPAISPTAFLIAAFAQCRSRNFSACAQEAQLGLQSPHRLPYLYYLDANALWNMGAQDQSKILSELTAALDHLPHCTTCLDLRSKVFESMGNQNAALADLNKLTEQDAESAPAWYRLAQLYKKLGRPKESASAFHHYQAIHAVQANQEVESFRQQFLPH